MNPIEKYKAHSKEWEEGGVCIRTKAKNCPISPYSSRDISYVAPDTHHLEFANPFRSESPVSLFLVCSIYFRVSFLSCKLYFKQLLTV